MKKQLMPDVIRKVAIALLFFVSINALAAGYSFITQPSGSGLGISTDYLRSSAPFADYLVPGIILFIVLGVGSSVVAILALVKNRKHAILIAIQGSIIICWIFIQLFMVDSFHILHLIIGVAGIILMAIGYGLLPEKALIKKPAL